MTCVHILLCIFSKNCYNTLIFVTLFAFENGIKQSALQEIILLSLFRNAKMSHKLHRRFSLLMVKMLCRSNLLVFKLVISSFIFRIARLSLVIQLSIHNKKNSITKNNLNSEKYFSKLILF